ncbi:MAG: sporulation protein YjcZ [Turicibacter sp.]|nr:sporulation protein YjcZ [Turicibacter sp.]
MYNYGYNCYTPCAPVAPVTNNYSGGCGGFAFILVLFILLANICGCGGFCGRGCGYSNDCSCGC